MQEYIAVGILLILGLGAYWAMVIYPRQRDFQKRQQYVSALNEGDEVITYGGMIARVIRVDAEKGIVHAEIADGVVVRLIAAAVVQKYDAEELALNAQKGLGGDVKPEVKG
jgi:preprotein translocase subunit YajC